MRSGEFIYMYVMCDPKSLQVGVTILCECKCFKRLINKSGWIIPGIVSVYR